MREIENCVEVRISGPKDQMKHYLDWIQQSGEYQYATGVNAEVENPNFYLTAPIQDHPFWHFSSSNLKHKVRLFQRFKKEVFKFRVNYMIYYGTHHLSDEVDFHLNEEAYNQAIFPDLVRAFNAMPECIAKLCPDLKATTHWDSYYIEHNFDLKKYNDEDGMYTSSDL